MRVPEEGKNLFSWTPGFGILNPPAEEMVKTGLGGADIYEQDGRLHFEIEVPGLNREDTSLQVDNNYLMVRGELKKQQQVQKDQYLRMERQSGLFQRSYPIPEEADTNRSDQIRATYENGILTVSFPLEQNINKNSQEIQID